MRRTAQKIQWSQFPSNSIGLTVHFASSGISISGGGRRPAATPPPAKKSISEKVHAGSASGLPARNIRGLIQSAAGWEALPGKGVRLVAQDCAKNPVGPFPLKLHWFNSTFLHLELECANRRLKNAVSIELGMSLGPGVLGGESSGRSSGRSKKFGQEFGHLPELLPEHSISLCSGTRALTRAEGGRART